MATMSWRTVCRMLVVAAAVMALGYVDAVATEKAAVPAEEGKVVLMWGIADTTAAVGRLFKYHIPSDAFKGEIAEYQVVEAGKERLPAWLHFESSQNLLKGIPTPGDAVQLYLEVIAIGPSGQRANDVFSVAVSGSSTVMSSGQPIRFKSSGPEHVRCRREEPETVATIVVDADLSGLPASQRLELVEKFLSHMGLAEEMVKTVPAKAKLLQDDTALVTGTGDALEPRFPGVALSWLVGCGKVEAGHFPVLQLLDEDSSSGEMGRKLGHAVVGWRVTNTRFQQKEPHSLKRRRRQVQPTATPVITMAPPTATDKDDDAMTREVVDMSSPTFTIEPTPTTPDMPKTTTPKPAVTTPKMPTKPDKVEPSSPTEPTSTTTKTQTLPPMKKTTTMKPMKTTKKTTQPDKPDVLKPGCDTLAVDNKIEKLTFLVGEVVNYVIPKDTLTFCGEPGTRRAKLNLFRSTTTKIADDWFLQFDQKTQTLRGLPMEGDVGTYEMNLVAMRMDRPSYVQPMGFRIVVRKPKGGRKARVNHEMAMTIDTDYDEFMGSVDKRLDLAGKVASVFGDENTSALTVTKIARGSVVYAFTNNTLSGKGCPVDDITALADKVVTADGKITAAAQEKLKPWVLTAAATAPEGNCVGDPNFPNRSATVDPTAVPGTPKTDSTAKPGAKTDAPAGSEKPKSSPATPNVTGVATAGKSSEDDIWINTVVPAVVIVAILLVALLVACILYRKKRKGKMNLEDQNTFVNKGAPVIFPEELEEKPCDSNKPLLMEGSPPAPPPEYHRGNSESPEQLRNNHHHDYSQQHDEVDADIEIDAASPLYQPPPPVTASSGKQARPHVQQPYRSQPPEIHP